MSQPAPLTEPNLAAVAGARHGFFTRAGGVSRGLYESLNVGQGSRDDPAAVRENRRRAQDAFGPRATLVTAYQVHSAVAVWVDGPWPGEAPRADALVTDRPGLMLGALAADCAPVLIVDPAARIIAAAHAGWRGALGGVVEATVDLMARAGADRSHLIAAIGPCIGPASYEVGLEFVETFEAADRANVSYFRPAARAEKRLFDLPAYVLGRLAASGVERAVWVGRDTCAEADPFFSNRRATQRGEADYGRLLSAIMLEPRA